MVAWSAATKIVFRFFFAFILLFILSFSFPHEYLHDIGSITSPFFEMLAKWAAENIFNIKQPFTSELISDSTGLYVHVFNLFIISVIICFVWSVTDKKRNNYDKFFHWLVVIARYYLALQLFVYGFNKVFKMQFYLPEPNTLYTPLGNISPDLLYWSTMGISRTYTMFLGCAEVLAAYLLLFRKTSLFAALISIAILINVLAINFGFDISVKVYSAFLLLLAIVIVSPDAKRMFIFFFSQKQKDFLRWEPVFTSAKAHSIYQISKTIVICAMLFDVLSVYFINNNFNDDKTERPPLHGAYEVTLFLKDKDTLAPLLTDTVRWKKMFIHRKGYLIPQLMNDEMQDYKLQYDLPNKKLLIANYETGEKTFFTFTQPSESEIILNGKLNSNDLTIHLKKINLSDLPALQSGFHWTVDE